MYVPATFYDTAKARAAFAEISRDVAIAEFRGEQYILYFKPWELTRDDEIALKHMFPSNWKLRTGTDNDRPITYLYFK